MSSDGGPKITLFGRRDGATQRQMQTMADTGLAYDLVDLTVLHYDNISVFPTLQCNNGDTPYANGGGQRHEGEMSKHQLRKFCPKAFD
eukprot:NODE_3078_length_424_cov_465.578667_g2566_i0.p1 GENE.NODE_3078_length_424_cov_465.578667_g2566_i0~~NODE_3078_length_424_cov_465.578667_g2566_i0.p1  ORF type:complete len:88 (+),score=7.84 NODE_3078_length_424_cov_465.578667_g2566_i0:75-338(+)